VEPVSLEETLPDGRVFGWEAEEAATEVRLHLVVENLSEGVYFVAWCGRSGLAIVPRADPKPFCEPFGVADWSLLAPRRSIAIYPSVTIYGPAKTGVFTEQLEPHGHAPVENWPTYKAAPVTFHLSDQGCARTAVVNGGEDH
jgi:hypothetical protein